MACKMHDECPFSLVWLYSFSFIAYIHNQNVHVPEQEPPPVCWACWGILGARVQLPKGSGAQWHLFP